MLNIQAWTRWSMQVDSLSNCKVQEPDLQEIKAKYRERPIIRSLGQLKDIKAEARACFLQMTTEASAFLLTHFSRSNEQAARSHLYIGTWSGMKVIGEMVLAHHSPEATVQQQAQERWEPGALIQLVALLKRPWLQESCRVHQQTRLQGKDTSSGSCRSSKGICSPACRGAPVPATVPTTAVRSFGTR